MLHKITSFLERLERVGSTLETITLVILLTGMMLLAVGQIVLREIFNTGFVWADELIKLMVLWLALAFLEVQCVQSKDFKNLADVIRAHRAAHSQRLLVEACQLAMQAGDLAPVLERYMMAA